MNTCKLKPNPKHPGKVFLDVEDVKGDVSSYNVFDVRYNLTNKDYGINEYKKGHVPQATFVDLDVHLSKPAPPNSKARHVMPDPQVFIEWCKSVGIGPQKPVLCYDDECGAMGACRMWWMLHALGVEAYVLTCGYRLFEAGYSSTDVTDSTKHQPTSYWPYETEFKRLLNIKETPPNAHMVDTRPAYRFNTTVRPYWPDDLPGHIEGAVNLPFSVNIVQISRHEKRLRPNDECRSNILKLLAGMWDMKKADISHCVFYCGSGVTAAFSIAVACHVGLGEPYLLSGSWSEYADVFDFHLRRSIIKEYGMLLTMTSPTFADNVKASSTNATLMVDDEIVESPDEELAAAFVHLHVGEKAKVLFESQREVTIEAYPRIDT
uniref:Putative mercaptopyruvate sulfurtransferase n=1 Tax=Trypanosoma congolense (strain IL3000) TaxID=1068625 RepID=G0UQL9_TRYCI|nr:putative mercaptopyruvate sulfurtransferase [Trypanosoma congolense IL3000]